MRDIWSFYRIFSIPGLDSSSFLLVSALGTEIQRDSCSWMVCLWPMSLLFWKVVPQISTWFHEILHFKIISPAADLLKKYCSFNMIWDKVISPTLNSNNVDLTYSNAADPWKNLAAPQSTSTRKERMIYQDCFPHKGLYVGFFVVVAPISLVLFVSTFLWQLLHHFFSSWCINCIEKAKWLQ